MRAPPATPSSSPAPTPWPVEGFDRALARAALYRDAGADVLFVEAPRQHEEFSRIGARLGKSAPLMVNMVEGGKTPMLPAGELEALGFSLVIFPGAIVRTLAKAAEDFYVSLKTHGSTDPFRARMFDFDALNRPDRHRRNAGARQALRGEPPQAAALGAAMTRLDG